MTVSDGELVKVVVTHECPDTVIAQNVFYYQLDDSGSSNPSNDQISTALDTEFTALWNTIEAYVTPEYNCAEIKIDKIEWISDVWETVENIGVETIGVVGGAAQNAVPHGCAGVITANTTRPQTRARKFIAGLGEGTMDDSTLLSATLTALAAFVTEWLSGRGVVGGAVLEPVVVGFSGPSAGLTYILISAAANAIAGYQRRRKPGVGS